jgi:hypothetical protein
MKLGLLDNPTRQEVINYYLNLTIFKAYQLFINSHGIQQDRDQARYLMRLMRENDVLFPVGRNTHFHVKDFIYCQDHAVATSTILSAEPFEAVRNECLNTYESFTAFLNAYLKDLLKSYGHEPITNL